MTFQEAAEKVKVTGVYFDIFSFSYYPKLFSMTN